MNPELKIIKKKYGEKMMHLCRELFPTILEQPGLLTSILSEKFAFSRFLYDDIVQNNLVNQFKDYIYCFVDLEDENAILTQKSTSELFEEAGYDLYECKTEEDIQSFRKYYQKREEICTFRGGRLTFYYVFFAVKKNVDEIKRENFPNPERQDEYGTSVISIQFGKGKINTLSIKNRYNHIVKGYDATFSNNLENIIPGLTKSFERDYNLNINQNGNDKFKLPNYVKANDKKFYKYNYKINDIYYCPNNIIIDRNFNVIRQYDEQEKYIIMDYFILDLENKKIELYDKYIHDSFLDEIKDIEKIIVTKEKETGNKQVVIICKNSKLIIEINKHNKIIGYENSNLTEMGNNFLIHNDSLINLKLPNVSKIGNMCLYHNNSIKSICLPNVVEIGDNFLYHNNSVENIYLPKVEFIGSNFFCCNNSIKSICLPNTKIIKSYFLKNNKSLMYLNLPNLIEMGHNCLFSNVSLISLYMPNIRILGDNFLYSNNTLEYLELLELEKAGTNILNSNTLVYLCLSNLEAQIEQLNRFEKRLIMK